MRRRLAFLVVLLAAVAAGVASASAITAQMDDDATPGLNADDVQPDGSGAVVPVTAADPDGRPAFALRVYRSKTGLTCPEVGRTQGGRFGQVDEAGSFHALALEGAGSCADLGERPLSLTVNYYPGRGKAPARAVVFGVVTPRVAAITLSLPSGARKLDLARGAYMAVVRDDALAGAALDVTLADGKTTSYPLAPNTAPATIPAGAPTG